MERFDITTLMAYADGELDAETAREVEAYLDQSPEARETVGSLQRSAGLARAALNEAINETVPERLIAAVTTSAPIAPAPRSVRPLLRLLAAGVAGLMIGAGGIAAGVRFGAEPSGPVMTAADHTLRDGVLQHTLEKRVSGTDGVWHNPDTGHSGVIVPTRTVQRPDGVFCRQYRETTRLGGADDLRFGLACRQADGSWKVSYELVPKEEESVVH